MSEQSQEVTQNRRDVCLRLAYEIPAACVLGGFAAGIIGAYVRKSMGPASPLPHDYVFEVMHYLPWVVLAVCFGLLIYAKPYWAHYILFVLYFLIASIFSPYYYY